MVRWVLVPLAFVLGTIGTAAAKKKVLIISKPEKAAVYVGSLEAGKTCTTPCTVEIEGETTVILDLAGYRPKSDQVSIGRRERAPYKRTYNLVPSVGTLKIEGPAGANVYVDGKDSGKIPFESDVGSGTHTVMVKLDGKEIYVNTADVTEDEEVKITVEATVATKDPDEKDPDEKDPDPTPVIRRPLKPSGPRAGNLFSVSAALSVGFRDFAYRGVDPMTERADLGPESEGGQVLAGGQLELWPGTLAGIRVLRGFALVGRFQYGLNPQTVVQNGNNAALDAKTFWTSLEISARQQFLVANKLIAEVGVGYVGDQHQFEGGDSTKVPDAFYQSLKIGARLAVIVGNLEPSLAVENRIVMSSGPLSQRFGTDGSSVSGFRAAAGVGMKFGNLVGRVEGSLTRYSWTISGISDTTGATDDITQVSMTVGYAY